MLACERFRHYLVGGVFTLVTDCKAVELIIKNPNAKPPARFARFLLRLMDYDFVVVHKPGAENMADYLSRSPMEWLNHHGCSRQSYLAEQHIHFVSSTAAPRAVKVDELIEATRNDEVLQTIIQLVRNGREDKSKALAPYLSNKHELSVAPNGLLLRDSRIVVPSTLRHTMVRIAHEGHQGFVKTAKLVAERVWFPGMRKMVDDLIASCPECQLTRGGNNPQPLKMTNMPPTQWTSLSLDFYGPLANGRMLLAINDQCTRFPVVVEVASTAASSTLQALDRVFTDFGVPESIMSDNGPPFNGVEFAEFCAHFGTKHRRITPLHPQANGQSENFMRNLKKIVANSFHNGSDYKQELNAFLRSYRSSPHASTGAAPAALLFRQPNLCRLPKLQKPSDIDNRPSDITRAMSQDAKSKSIMKRYADERRRAKQHSFDVGDEVLLDESKSKTMRNKKKHRFSRQPFVVRAVKGSMVTAERNGSELVRDASFFKRCTATALTQSAPVDEFELECQSEREDEESDRPTQQSEARAASDGDQPADHPTTLRRSERASKAPDRYVDVRNRRGRR